SEVSVSWTDVAEETGYELERRQGSGGSWLGVASTGANQTTFADTGLTANTEYRYRIRAFNDAGFSDYSTEELVVTPELPEPEATVVLLESDTLLSGDWRARFGNEGYLLAGATGAPPDYLATGAGLEG